MTTDRRNPHRPFDRSLIQPFLRGRDIISAQLLPSGKINTSYKLVLSDGQACVVRLYSRGDAAREVAIMDLVRDLVPVPLEIDRGEGWSVFSFLEGELLQRVPEHSAAAARALVRISSVEFESPGWINQDGSVSPFSFGGGDGFTAEMLARADVRAWLGEEAVQAVVEILDREAERCGELDAESRLVHGDFNPTNILVRDGEVSGILDWEFSHSGTPYMDIGNLLRNTNPSNHHRIAAGLHAGGMSLPEDWQERAELVDLSSHLEFLTSTRSDSFKRQCVARVHAFIRRFREP
jgi:aminoglycoside phosphotransferase (APT) family kinase protein